jgi:hypothetical protein
MPDAQRVTIQVAPPRDGSPGQVSFGYFVMNGNKLTMTDADGKPVRRQNGDTVTRTLLNGENPRAIAAVLTRDLRKRLNGTSDFNRPLSYPNIGIV